MRAQDQIKHFFITKHPLLSVMLFLALVVSLITFPALFSLNTQLIGDGGDNYEYFTYQNLVHQNLLAGRLPFSHTDTLFYPVGFDLTLVDGRLTNLLGGILNFLFEPVLTYNLVVLLVFWLNGLSAYFFFTALFQSRKLGLLASIIAAYSYQRLSYGAGFLNLMPAFGFFLAGYALTRIFKYRDTKLTTIGLFFSSAYITALNSLQSFLMFVGTTGIIGLIALMMYRQELWQLLSSKTTLFKIVWCGLCFIFVFSLTFDSWLMLILNNTFGHHHHFIQGNIINGWQVPLQSYFIPNKYLPTGLQRLVGWGINNWTSVRLTSKSVEINLFLGYVELALFAAFLCIKKKKFDVFMLVCLIAVFTVSLGKVPYLPTSRLFEVLPFRGIYETYRLFAVYYIFFTYCAVVAIKKLLTQFHGSRKIVWLFFVIIVMERVSINYYLSPTHNTDSMAYVKNLPTQAVVFLPLQVGDATSNNVLSIHSSKKIIDGYTHWAAKNQKRDSFIGEGNIFNRFNCDFRSLNFLTYSRKHNLITHQLLNTELLKKLRSVGIEHIIESKENASHRSCVLYRTAAATLFTADNQDVIKVYEDENIVHYQIVNITEPPSPVP